MAGIKGATKFGLLTLDNCVNDRCNSHDYEWLAKYTKLWHSDTGGCQGASRSTCTASHLPPCSLLCHLQRSAKWADGLRVRGRYAWCVRSDHRSDVRGNDRVAG